MANKLIATVVAAVKRLGKGSGNRIPDHGARLKQSPTIRVVVLTMLAEEYQAAVQAIFDGNGTHHAGNTLQYRIGSVRSLIDETDSIPVAITRTVDTGLQAGAAAASQAVRDFPDLECLLLVGIAGCIPCPEDYKAHIRRGDILICTEKPFNFLRGKDREESFELVEESIGLPSVPLIKIAISLIDNAVFGDRPWEAVIERTSNALKSLSHEEWSYPGIHKDELFGIDQESDREVLIQHPLDPQRTALGTFPRIFTGRFGSSDQLIRNASTRDRLRTEHKIIAFEMEGAGVARAARDDDKKYIIIRGANDYSDDHKNDYWKCYASVVAAAFARCLIERLPAKAAPLYQTRPLQGPGLSPPGTGTGIGYGGTRLVDSFAVDTELPFFPEATRHESTELVIDKLIQEIDFSLQVHEHEVAKTKASDLLSTLQRQGIVASHLTRASGLAMVARVRVSGIRQEKLLPVTPTQYAEIEELLAQAEENTRDT